MTRSEKIKAFLDLVEETKREYDWASENRIQQEKLESDLLHKIELGTAEERRKAQSRLTRCLKDRRKYKDTEHECKILVDWAESEKKAINQLKKVLGEVRKEEKYRATRTYKPKAYKED